MLKMELQRLINYITSQSSLLTSKAVTCIGMLSQYFKNSCTEYARKKTDNITSLTIELRLTTARPYLNKRLLCTRQN